MFRRKQIKYNTPFLFLVKHKGVQIYDLFILIEIAPGTRVEFPENDKFPQSSEVQKVDIIITSGNSTSSNPPQYEIERITFDFSNQNPPQNPVGQKIVVTTWNNNIGGMSLRRMEVYFDQDYEIEAIPAGNLAIDCPYFFLGIDYDLTGGIPGQNGATLFEYTPYILIPTYGGKILKATNYISKEEGAQDKVITEIELEPSKGTEDFHFERINQATFYAESGQTRDFEVEMVEVAEVKNRSTEDEKVEKEKKKVKTRHGNSSGSIQQVLDGASEGSQNQ